MSAIRTARATIAVVAMLVLFSACAQSGPEKVNPMRTPRRVDDITGIWRSPQQSTLELRANGSYVLITPVSDALAGEYTLSQDRITFFGTKTCGGAQGTYRIQVSYQQRVLFTDPDDACAIRRNQLTADPLVYG